MRVVDRSKIVLRYTPKPKPWACCHGCTINRESRDSTRPIVRVWLIVPRSCWGSHQSHSHQHAAMDAPSTENQGIQPDPLYACGWLFQDRVEVHTKAKQAFSTLPWIIINRESRNKTGPVVCVWLIVPRSCWGTHQSQSIEHAAMDAPSTENQGIRPDPLYACGWSFQDRVDVHTKAIAVSMLPWMHHQQRIKEYNRTRCTRVVDCSKIMCKTSIRGWCSVLTQFSLTVKLVHKIMSSLLSCAPRRNTTRQTAVSLAILCHVPEIRRGNGPKWEFHIPS